MRDSVDALFARARALHDAGRDEQAQAAYVELLQLDATHLDALTDLGNLLTAGNFRSAALVAYRQAAAAHPQAAGARANYANALFHDREYVAARAEYEAALALEPGLLPAHQGLSLALDRLGDAARARRHRDIGFGGQPIQAVPNRGGRPAARAVALLATRGGNVHIERFLDDRSFAVAKIFPEYYDGALPAHDLVFNAIADVELGAEALAAGRRLLRHTNARVVNRPEAVARTGRAENAGRLASIPGVIAPRTVDYARGILRGPDAGQALANDGFRFPLLVRSPGYHTGLHFVKIDGPERLAAAIDALPGERLTAIELLDARGPDGLTRKYRVVIVDGKLFPLHAAVAADWKVHYFSAAMADHPERRAEDDAFLVDIGSVIGDRALTALGAIAGELGLEFAGVDFGVDAHGNVLLFEANAAMVVPAPSNDTRFAYRAEALQRIDQAMRALMLGTLEK